MEFVSLTDRRIATTKGHVIIFQARKPQRVPAMVEQEMIAAGLMPIGGSKDLEELKQLAKDLNLEPVEKEAPVEVEAKFDQAVFETAIREIIAKNDPADLTPGGQPKVKALEALTGYTGIKALRITNFLKSTE